MNEIKLVALYKTFSGIEFLRESVHSIYNSVDEILFVHSRISWTGELGNKVIPELDRLLLDGNFDPLGKIRQIYVTCIDQEDQYREGFKCITNTFLNKPTHILLVDTDEVWDSKSLEELKKFVSIHPDYESYSAQIKTYIKSPYFQIDPPEELDPTCIVRYSNSLHVRSFGPRCNSIKPRINSKIVGFHHYSYVRSNFDSILKKMETSHKGDNEESTERSSWISKWDNLPNSTNFHPTKTYEHYWKGVKVISREEMPDHLRYSENELLNSAYSPITNRLEVLPKGELYCHDEWVLRNYSQGVTLSVDLGTSGGRSATIMSETSNKVLTVDVFEDISRIEDEGQKEHYTNHIENIVPRTFEGVVNTLSLYPNIEVKKGLSYILAQTVEDRSVEFLFIDADHSSVGVTKDYDAWINKMSNNSYIYFHDTWITELRETVEKIISNDNLRVIKEFDNAILVRIENIS